jgi:hypothetical protein
MYVSYECCVLSGRGLCDRPIPRAEESYRLWRVIVCDLETARWGSPDPRWAVAPQTDKILWTPVALISAHLTGIAVAHIYIPPLFPSSFLILSWSNLMSSEFTQPWYVTFIYIIILFYMLQSETQSGKTFNNINVNGINQIFFNKQHRNGTLYMTSNRQ